MRSIQLSKNTTLQSSKYCIESVLGQGGFGITYLATQEILERKVCIKEFFMRDFCSRSESDSSVTLGTSANKELLERYLAKFVKEARTISQLEHPNIIHIHDIFKENGTAYYVMDYIEGESLSDLVKRRGALPEEEAVTYIRAVAEALRYVHARSINHLDVKPGNIMVRTSDHHVFLLDFGLSKQYDVAGNQTSSTPLGISHGYAPIEQYSPEGIKSFSPQTDIYSLGATLYYLITGKTPPSASELFASELSGFPTTLSATVRKAIQWAMEPQKKDRPQNVVEFLNLLLKYVEKTKNDEEQIKFSQQREKGKTIVHEETQNASINIGYRKEKRQNNEEQIASSINKTTKSRRINSRFIVWLTVIVFAGCSYLFFYNKNAEELFHEGMQDLERGNYTKAVSLLEKSANQDYTEAQVELGMIYNAGEGGMQDYTKAAFWYQKAAEKGNVNAQCSLAYLYMMGQGVTQNSVAAVEWYQKAALQGDAVAQYNLGMAYAIGEGTIQNYEKAIEWLTKSAEQGNAKAQYNLGLNYYNGQGVLQDYAKAIEWFQKAADQKSAEAQNALGVMYEYGAGVNQNSVLAFRWYQSAAEQDFAPAQCNLGTIYEEGKGVKINYKKAVEWYRKAAEQGYADGQCFLGLMYEYGRGIEQDYSKAIEWFRKAVEQNHAWGQRLLGVCYQSGIGVTCDYTTAAEWYKKSAEQGDAISQRLLGYLYEKGLGVVRNIETALEWYGKSAEQGDENAIEAVQRINKGSSSQSKSFNSTNKHESSSTYHTSTSTTESGNATQISKRDYLNNSVSKEQFDLACKYYASGNYTLALKYFRISSELNYAPAQYFIGVMYENGKGVRKSYVEALFWYRKAAENGYAFAQVKAGKMYEMGTGVYKNKQEALKWYKMAMDQGLSIASEYYKKLSEE